MLDTLMAALDNDHDTDVLISQSGLNHSRSLLDAAFVIERGANVVASAARASAAR